MDQQQLHACWARRRQDLAQRVPDIVFWQSGRRQVVQVSVSGPPVEAPAVGARLALPVCILVIAAGRLISLILIVQVIVAVLPRHAHRLRTCTGQPLSA